MAATSCTEPLELLFEESPGCKSGRYRWNLLCRLNLPSAISEAFALNGWYFGPVVAVRYSIERQDPTSKQWVVVCDKCATDTDDPWADPHPGFFGVSYRVTAWNADGIASPPSQPR